MNTTASPPTVAMYLFTLAVRCPSCGSRRLRTYKTIGQDEDDTILRYSFCRSCGQKLKIVEE